MQYLTSWFYTNRVQPVDNNVYETDVTDNSTVKHLVGFDCKGIEYMTLKFKDGIELTSRPDTGNCISFTIDPIPCSCLQEAKFTIKMIEDLGIIPCVTPIYKDLHYDSKSEELGGLRWQSLIHSDVDVTMFTYQKSPMTKSINASSMQRNRTLLIYNDGVIAITYTS